MAGSAFLIVSLTCFLISSMFTLVEGRLPGDDAGCAAEGTALLAGL
jgi:hypothetical protein